MFGFLKDKLKQWSEKISSEKADEVKEVKTKKVTKNTDKKDKSSKKAKKVEKKKSKKQIEKEKVEVKLEKEIESSEEGDSDESEELEEEEESLDEEIEDIKDEEVSEDIIYNETEEIEKPKSKQGFFSRLVSSKIVFTEEDFDSHKEDLEMLLLENNVAFDVVDKILVGLREELVGKEISKKGIEEEIMIGFREVVSKILIEPFDIFERIKNKDGPYIILFCGINGTGKTTTIAKVASMLKKKGISSCMAAGDTFRAASIEQLKTHADRVGVPIISSEYGSDPASVGFEAISYAKKNNIQVVLIDSAGRMHTAKNLMAEIEKVARVCKPDLKIFVGESITGNDIIEQVKAFNSSVGIDGIVLSKADIDEKGGSAISVGYITGKPILFLGVGQEYKDLEVFDKEKFLDKIFQ